MTPETELTPKPLSITEFAAKIKAKHKEYAEVDDRVLAARIVRKYPQYQQQVDFGTPEENEAAASVAEGQFNQARSNLMSATGQKLNPNAVQTIKRPKLALNEEGIVSLATDTEIAPLEIVHSQTPDKPVTRPLPIEATRPRRVSPIALDSVVQGRLEAVKQQRRQVQSQQRVQKARQTMQAAPSRADLERETYGQQEQWNNVQQNLGLGRPIREELSARGVEKAKQRESIRPQIEQQVRAERQARRRKEAAVPAGIISNERIWNPERLNTEADIQKEVDLRTQEAIPEIAWREQHGAEIDALTKQYRDAMKGVTRTQGNKWTAETVSKGVSGITEFFSGAVKQGGRATSLLTGNAQTTDEAANQMRIHAEALQRAAMEEGADRSQASRFVSDVAGGLIGSAPEMGLMALGVPGPLAFAIGGGTRAAGTDKNVGKATLHGAATGAAFELGATGRGLTRIATKAGGVGLGTAGVELTTGATPREAAQAGATNALISLGFHAKEIPKAVVDYTVRSPLTPEPVRDALARTGEYDTWLYRAEDGRNMSIYRDPNTGAFGAVEIDKAQADKYDQAVNPGKVSKKTRRTTDVESDVYDDLARVLGVETNAPKKGLKPSETPASTDEVLRRSDVPEEQPSVAVPAPEAGTVDSALRSTQGPLPEPVAPTIRLPRALEPAKAESEVIPQVLLDPRTAESNASAVSATASLKEPSLAEGAPSTASQPETTSTEVVSLGPPLEITSRRKDATYATATLKDGSQVSMSARADGDTLAVSASKKGGTESKVGHAFFVKQSDGKYSAARLSVERPEQRKGVATALYDLAEQHGIDVRPSKPTDNFGGLPAGMTADAEAFWSNRKSSPQAVKPTQETLGNEAQTSQLSPTGSRKLDRPAIAGEIPNTVQDIDSAKKMLTPEQLAEVEEYETLRHKSAMSSYDKKVKLTAREKARGKALEDKYGSIFFTRFNRSEWRKAADAAADPFQKNDILRSIVRRGVTPEELTDVLDRGKNLESQLGPSLSNLYSDVAHNSAATPEIKARAEKLYGESFDTAADLEPSSSKAAETKSSVKPTSTEQVNPETKGEAAKTSSIPSVETKPTPESSAAPIMSREDVKAAMREHFKLPEAEADAVSMLTDARAETWAKQTGKPKEEWYRTRIAGITSGGEAGEGALYQGRKADYEPSLLAAHNLSTDNLRHAMDMGGLAVPSLGVIDANKSEFHNFGEITLLAKSDLINPQMDKSAKVFNADAYSPRYPTVTHFMEGKSATKLRDFLGERLDKVGSKSFSRWSLEGNVGDKGVHVAMENDPSTMLAYLVDTGQRLPKFSKDGNQSADFYEVRKRVTYNPKENAKYQKWITDTIKSEGIQETSKIFNGYTYSGNRRYLKHDLDTVVKLMKKGLQDGEGFNYGVPSIRATYSRRFRTLEQIKAARDKIIPTKQMEALKEEVNEEFLRLQEKAAPYREGGAQGLGSLDQFSDDLKAMAQGDWKHIREVYPKGAPPEMRAFLEKLREMPTEYFEAKVQRAVGLHEFESAIIPKETSAEMVEALRKRGIQTFTYDRKKPETRTAAIKKAGEKQNLLFQDQKASVEFLADNRAIIRALEKPDVSSAAHEVAHVFRRDLEGSLLKVAEDWAGVKDGEWKTEHEERFARGFEEYLREGKSPSEKLRAVFEQFKNWLREIYKTIKGSPLEGKLSPEMRKVFDGLLTETKAEKKTPASIDPEGQKPRSLPLTLDAAGLESGETKGYTPETLAEGVEYGKKIVTEKGLDGAMEFVRTGDGIEWASTGFEASAQLRAEEARLRSEGKTEEAGAVQEKRLKFLDDFALGAVERGRSIVGIKAISEFAPDRMAYMLNKASLKKRKRGITPEEDARIAKLGDELGALEERNDALQKRLDEALSRAKKTTKTSKPAKVDYQSKLDEQATTLLQTLKPKVGKFDFASLGRGSEKGALTLGIPELPGDAELLAQYAASQLSKQNTVADLNEHLLSEFGEEIEPYLPKIRQRAYAIRQEARLAEIEAQETEPKRRKTILGEIQKEIADSLNAIRDAQKAQETALKVERKADARSMRAEAREQAKQAKETERERQKQIIKDARVELKRLREEMKQASKAETEGYRETIKTQREAARRAELWDTPLRNEAKEARERLKTATDPKDPQTMEDLVSLAAEHFLPDEIGGVPRKGAVEPAKVYRDLKDEFPELVTKKNQGEIYKRGYQRIQDMTAAAREAARLRSASAESKRLWNELGVDVDAQAVLIKQAEVRRQTDELRRKAVGEFERVSKTLPTKVWEELQAFPRSLTSSIDAPLGRQGVFFLLMHPIRVSRTAIPATVRGYRALRIADYAQHAADFKKHPRYDLAKRARLDLSEPAHESSDPLIQAEEQFQSPLASKMFPHVRLSEQGYVLGMNAERLEVFSNYAALGEAEGYTWENNPEFFETAASFINDGTGRGELSDALKQASKLTNFFFFSTRLNISRLKLLNDLFNPVKIARYDPVMRKIVTGSLLKLALGLGFIFLTAKAMGIGVELDPEDPDAYLLRVRNTRYDITGGEVGTIRFLFKFLKATYATANGEDLAPYQEPLAIAGKFLRYKLAPLPSGVIDAYTGKDAVGNPASLTKFDSPKQVAQENIIARRLMPMIAGQFIDTISEEGYLGIPMVAPAVAGFGVSSYPDRGLRALKNQGVIDTLERLKITSQSLIGQKTKDDDLDDAIQKSILKRVEALKVPDGTDIGQETLIREQLGQFRTLAKAEAAIAEPGRYRDYLINKAGSETFSFLTDEERAKVTEADVKRYRTFYADAYLAALKNLSSNEQFATMTDENKAKALARLGQMAHNLAKGKMKTTSVAQK